MIRKLFQNKKFMNSLGWSGSGTILGAYGMNTHKLTDNQNLLDGMNIYGSFTLGLVCFKQRAWQAFALEAVWFGIATTSLGSSYYKRYRQKQIKNIDKD